MNRQDYMDFVMKIWEEPEEQTIRSLAIAGLGIIGEAGEVCEVLLDDGVSLTNAHKIVDECGDVLYYTTVLADWQGWFLDDIWPDLKPQLMLGPGRNGLVGMMLVRDAKEVSERVKKFIRDDAEPGADELRKRLRQVLFSLSSVLRIVGADLVDSDSRIGQFA